MRAGQALGNQVFMTNGNDVEHFACLSAAVALLHGKPKPMLNTVEEPDDKSDPDPNKPVKVRLDLDESEHLLLKLMIDRAGSNNIPRKLRGASAHKIYSSSANVTRTHSSLEERDQRSRDLLQSQMNNSHRIVSDLPTRELSAALLNIINSNTYSIIIGNTGCGKTTQVPQIIFEDAIKHGKGGSCNIVALQVCNILSFLWMTHCGRLC